jgi:hypothetical protein
MNKKQERIIVEISAWVAVASIIGLIIYNTI